MAEPGGVHLATVGRELKKPVVCTGRTVCQEVSDEVVGRRTTVARLKAPQNVLIYDVAECSLYHLVALVHTIEISVVVVALFSRSIQAAEAILFVYLALRVRTNVTKEYRIIAAVCDARVKHGPARKASGKSRCAF